MTTISREAAHATVARLPLTGASHVRAGVATTATFPVHSPADELKIADVADLSPEESVALLDAAADAFPGWSRTAPLGRQLVLQRIDRALREREEEFAGLISLENGKPVAEAIGEVRYAADFFKWYAEETTRSSGRTTALPDGTATIATQRVPVGPCLLITPWNVPLAMAARKIAPALAAGCTAILKPPELTPLSSLLLAEVAREAELPDGVLTVLTTNRAAEVSKQLMSDPRLRKVSFTGSTPVGKTLIAQSAQNVMRTSMELGGNAPFIVCEDADVELAVREALIAKMRAGGQSCVAANRFLVHDSIADAFAARFAEELARTIVGDPFDAASTLGPLVNGAAVDKATRLAEQARAQGAVEVFAGTCPSGAGHYFAPVLLDSVPESADIMHEEVFAPVAAIHRFTDDADAIRIANDTEFGLVAYVISESMARASAIAEALDAGMVGVNRGLVSNAAAPFGGFKSSGIGKEGGPEGLEEYAELKYYSVPKPAQIAPAAVRPR